MRNSKQIYAISIIKLYYMKIYKKVIFTHLFSMLEINESEYISFLSHFDMYHKIKDNLSYMFRKSQDRIEEQAY